MKYDCICCTFLVKNLDGNNNCQYINWFLSGYGKIMNVLMTFIAAFIDVCVFFNV